MRTSLLIKSFLFFNLLYIVFASRESIGFRDKTPPFGWENKGVAPHNEQVSFTIFLNEKNSDMIDNIFESVSDPNSPQWGKFLSKEELDEIVRPDEVVFTEIREWLTPYKFLGEINIIERVSSVKVSTSVAVASAIFRVPFHIYYNKKANKQLICYTGTATIPTKVRRHINLIAGISELFEGKIETHIGFDKYVQPTPKRTRDPSPTIIPSLLRQWYHVPDIKGSNPNNLQAIAAFTDEFSIGALRAFEADQGLPTANITRVGPDCFPNCDQFESDLDVQYITAMARNVNTLFIAQGNRYWILQTVDELLDTLPSKPLVISFSYGWSELAQCDIAVANCPKLGYDSIGYVRATNAVFKKLGILGISIFVSDGDDGAPNLGGASGNCPIDPNVYCPTGGCQHTTSACNSFTVKNLTTGDLCFFPMGIATPSCNVFLNDPNATAALDAFVYANPSCNLNLEQDRSQLPHFYSSCKCSDIQPVISNGYQLSQYTYVRQNGAAFTADYPTSSPYVTSVGATQFIGTSISDIKEVGCSIRHGAAITTGGGFSSFQSMPSYQKSAVQQYLNNPSSVFPPAWTFNTSNRGYPDISFCGHSYKIFYSEVKSDSCPCTSGLVDGTSASSPAFAGLITLINDVLLNNKFSQLGFINPLLYKMKVEAPQAFNDIKEGENSCNRAYCCQYGFSVSPGSWDPVTGLGTPNFANMLKYILSKKEEHKRNLKLSN